MEIPAKLMRLTKVHNAHRIEMRGDSMRNNAGSLTWCWPVLDLTDIGDESLFI